MKIYAVLICNRAYMMVKVTSNFDTIYVIRLVGRIVGMLVIDLDWQFNRYTLATCSVIIAFKVLSVYTIWICFNDPFHVIETVCCYGITIPVQIKNRIHIATQTY